MDISCSSAVGSQFDRALALLHKFWYARAFAFQVSDDDRECTMAYWGAAMTYNHPFWDPPSQADETAAWTLARGRRSWRSSFVGDPGSKFLYGKLRKAGRKEKGAKKEGKRKKGKKRDGIQTAELDRRDQVTATNSWPNSHRREGSRGR